MKTKFVKLTTPTPEIAKAFNKWANDSELIPLIRPNRNQDELDAKTTVTLTSLTERIEQSFTYLIYLDDQLVGHMDFQTDFNFLYKKQPNTAWIGICIGEAAARGKGIGKKALAYLEKQIKLQCLNRIELGVFAFNKPALELYQNSDYLEIGRVEKFTLYQGKMWVSIHFEKYF